MNYGGNVLMLIYMDIGISDRDLRPKKKKDKISLSKKIMPYIENNLDTYFLLIEV